ncbi:UNVERIFIED_ORG: hypothetical protein C7429_101134 [Pantoea allii]|nr:Uncharacterised protein [Pantoea agglomerans]
MLTLPGGFTKPERTQGVVLNIAWYCAEDFYHGPGRIKEAGAIWKTGVHP